MSNSQTKITKKMTLAEIVRIKREEKNLSKLALGRHSGVNAKTIERIENGQDTKFSNIIKLATYLDFTIDSLDYGRGQSLTSNKEGGGGDVPMSNQLRIYQHITDKLELIINEKDEEIEKLLDEIKELKEKIAKIKIPPSIVK